MLFKILFVYIYLYIFALITLTQLFILKNNLNDVPIMIPKLTPTIKALNEFLRFLCSSLDLVDIISKDLKSGCCFWGFLEIIFLLHVTSLI